MRQAEMQEKVVQLQVQLQRDLARLAEEEKARREEATTELTVEFKALAKKVSETSCVAFSFFFKKKNTIRFSIIRATPRPTKLTERPSGPPRRRRCSSLSCG
jgi:hypothetical protein